jgi:tetratricopeptide (TPR) repeat protein
MYNIREFSMGQRLLTESQVVLYYLSLLVFPNPDRLNLDYNFPVALSLLNPTTTLLAISTLIALIAAAAYKAREHRLLSFSILWFLVTLSVESSFIGLALIFEHRTYLPSMLAIFALVIVCSRIPAKGWQRVLVPTLILMLFSTWTFQRNMVWQDEVTLRRDAAVKSPEKSRALAILANALERNHVYDEAEHYYIETLALKPGNEDQIHYNLGNVLVARKKYDEAAKHFRQAVSLSPEIAIMRLNLAYALTLQGSLDEAVRELQELLRRYPGYPRGHNNLGAVLMKQGKFMEAAIHFNEALKLKPDYKQARMNLEAALIKLQREPSSQ